MANGKPGAPIGNRNSARGKIASQALHKALGIASGVDEMPLRDQYRALVEIWVKQIELALEGDKGSCQLIVERLEGKAAQALTIQGDEDRPVVTRIELVAPQTDHESIAKSHTINGELVQEVDSKQLEYSNQH